MAEQRIKYLVNRYFSETVTVAEQTELAAWISSARNDNDLQEILEHAWLDYKTPDAIKTIAGPVLTRIELNMPFLGENAGGIPTQRTVHRIHFLRTAWSRAAAAAIILFVLSSVAYLWLQNGKGKENDKDIVKSLPAKEIGPAGQKAFLTLADGSTIMLDSAANGQLAEQGNSKVIKLADGQLQYQTEGSENATVIAFNTMSTPRGGQYQVDLPDGTKVWLNAASSITYPTAFIGKERKVKVTGEVYFEVTKNPKMPFRVAVNEATEVEVLGTHFNINAYPDEGDIRTTLLEGSVKITSGEKGLILTPGAQAISSRNASLTLNKTVDLQQVMAWKNGYFRFEGTDIKAIMRQLEKWYDVDVVFKDQINKQFVANIPRTANLSDVLTALEKTGSVHLQIEGRKVIVSE